MSDVAPTDRQITLCRGQPLRVETTDPAVGRTLFLTRPAYLGDALARERPLASLITYALPRIDPAHDHDHHAVHIAHLESDKSAAGNTAYLSRSLGSDADGVLRPVSGSGSAPAAGAHGHPERVRHVDPVERPRYHSSGGAQDTARRVGCRWACEACMRPTYEVGVRTGPGGALPEGWAACPGGCVAVFCPGENCSGEARDVHAVLCEGTRAPRDGHAPYELRLHCEQVNPAFALAARLLVGAALRVETAVGAPRRSSLRHRRGSGGNGSGSGSGGDAGNSSSSSGEEELRAHAVPSLLAAKASMESGLTDSATSAASQHSSSARGKSGPQQPPSLASEVAAALAKDRLLTGFRRLPWWEVSPVDPDPMDSMTPEEHVHSMKTTSANAASLLRAVASARFCDEIVEAVFTAELHGEIMGLIERNSIEVDIAHPLVAAFEEADDMEHGADRAQRVEQLLDEVLLESGSRARNVVDDVRSKLQGGGTGRIARDSGDDRHSNDDDDNSNNDDDDDDEDEEEGLASIFADLLPSVEGIALFELFNGCLNHSCDPNCRIYFDDDNDTAVLRAIRPIANDEELLMSYIDEDLPVHERAAELLNYGFVCQCPACVSERAEAE